MQLGNIIYSVLRINIYLKMMILQNIQIIHEKKIQKCEQNCSALDGMLYYYMPEVFGKTIKYKAIQCTWKLWENL